MISTGLLLLLIGHFVGDFYLQWNKMVEEKRKSSIKYHLLHALLYAISIALFIIVFNEWWVILVISVSLGALHFGVDYLKSVINHKDHRAFLKAIIFSIDQIIHIVLLIVASIYLTKFNYFGQVIFEQWYASAGFALSYNKVLLHILSYVFCLLPSCVIARFVLDDVYGKKNISSENDDARSGTIIGILERVIMYTFSAFFVWYEIIPVVLAAKTFARFKRFGKSGGDYFTERYIIGTLLSTMLVGVCLIAGVFVR